MSAGRYHGSGLLLGIDLHAPELIYIENLSVQRQTLLFIDDRTTVTNLNDKCSDKEYRGCHNKCKTRQEYISQSFHEEIFRIGVIPLYQSHGNIIHIELLRASHQDIADLGLVITADLMLYAVFDNYVPVMAVKLHDKNSICIFDLIDEPGLTFTCRGELDFVYIVGSNQIKVLPELFVPGNLMEVMDAVIYDDGLPLIESPCVPFRYGNTPYKGYDDLKQYAYDEPEQFRPCPEQRSKDNEEQCIRKEKRDHLTEE